MDCPPLGAFPCEFHIHNYTHNFPTNTTSHIILSPDRAGIESRCTVLHTLYYWVIESKQMTVVVHRFQKQTDLCWECDSRMGLNVLFTARA